MAFLGYYVFRSGPLLLKSFNHWFIAESKGVEIPLDPNTSCPKSEQAHNHRFIAVEPHCCVDSILNCIHINLVLSCSNYFQLGSCLVWMHNVTRSSIRLNNVFHLWRLHRCLPKKQRSILVHALWYTAFLFRNTQQRGFEDKTENSALLKSWLKLRLCTNFLFIRFKCSVSTKIHLLSMYTLWYNLKTPVIDVDSVGSFGVVKRACLGI